MPDVTCADRAECDEALAESWARDARSLGERLARRIALRHRLRLRWSWPGECEACGGPSTFRVHRRSASYRVRGRRYPVWRETLACRGCGLNCRQRHVAGRLQELTGLERVYLTEQLTPFYRWAHRWARARSGDPVELIGSEYLPDVAARAHVPAGTRHEDVEALTFDDASLDAIVSSEVLEHVPDPDKALGEFARTLRPGGTLLLTVPFDPERAESRVRARVGSGGVEHLLEPVYHGNPVPGSEGSLVFSDFGWDLLERARAAGFERVSARVYGSRERGYLGGPHVLFVARR